jgi:predicted aspartyl protease
VKHYRLEKHWQLLFTRCAVKGNQGIITLRVLVDTGSTYTIMPIEALEAIGYNPVGSKNKVRITTASGYVVAPKIKVDSLNIFGKEIKSRAIVCYTLPEGIYADGIVGMDLLTELRAVIDIKNSSIQIMS